MLVLSRKKDERIILDGGIEICVVSIERDKVKIGVTAPQHVTVDRAEVFEAKKTQPVRRA